MPQQTLRLAVFMAVCRKQYFKMKIAITTADRGGLFLATCAEKFFRKKCRNS